ncbi:hypothetical protein PPOLYM_01671 [Paenibacillus polymyxa]|nr:hypothetical protein VK72_17860 [Paenibacillus polymyxa]VUG05291.1 hypothetical protein PPOLYM_01671 [Paenibacillus polymyxa]
MIYEQPSETYVLLKDGEVVFSGHVQEAERRYRNATHNQKVYGTRFKYEVITEKEYLDRLNKI